MCGSLCISGNVLRLVVLRSIDFDDETPFVAGEISEVRTDRSLSAEVRVIDWQTSQMPPEFAFRARHITTQSASARHASVQVSRSLTSSHARPSPLPPPHHSQELAGGGKRHRRAYIERKAALVTSATLVTVTALEKITHPPFRSGVPLPRSAWCRRPRTP